MDCGLTKNLTYKYELRYIIFDLLTPGHLPHLFSVFFPGLAKMMAKLGFRFFSKEFTDFFSSVVSQALEMREHETTVSRSIFAVI